MLLHSSLLSLVFCCGASAQAGWFGHPHFPKHHGPGAYNGHELSIATPESSSSSHAGPPGYAPSTIVKTQITISKTSSPTFTSSHQSTPSPSSGTGRVLTSTVLLNTTSGRLSTPRGTFSSSTSLKSSKSKSSTQIVVKSSNLSAPPSTLSRSVSSASSAIKPSAASLSRSSSTSTTCVSITRYSTISTLSVTTITYQIDHATASLLGDDFGYIPQFRPSTIYPTTVYTSAATSTRTVLLTPTTTVGAYFTSRVAAPSGFQDIQDTLPGWTIFTQGGADPAKKKRAAPAPAAAACTITVSSIVTIYTSTATATTVTTLTGTREMFIGQSTTFDNVGLSLFEKTYTGPVTTTATTPRTITISYGTTVTTTVTLPLQTVTGTSTTIYEACRTHNVALFQTSPAVPNQLTNSAQTPLPGYFETAYDCCVAAIQYGGVGFWQWNIYGGCQVQRPPTGTTNDCNQNEYTFSVNYYNTRNTTFQQSPWITGNGLCGIIDLALVYPESGEGTGGP